jgi:hypothetical protein
MGLTMSNDWNDWWFDGSRAPETRTVVEQEKPASVVVYDHTGASFVRPRQPMGFDLSGKKS